MLRPDTPPPRFFASMGLPSRFALFGNETLTGFFVFTCLPGQNARMLVSAIRRDLVGNENSLGFNPYSDF